MAGEKLCLRPYGEARPLVRDGDLLLFRRRGLISIAGRGDHSHAAKAAWWGDDLFCLEVREWHGGRAVTLSSQVGKFPARIDVYRTNPGDRWPEYDPRGATAVMRRLAGCAYGYGGVAAAALLHLPVARLFCQADVYDGAPLGRPPFCSQACALADRIGGGVGPGAAPGGPDDAAGRPGAQPVLCLSIHPHQLGPVTCGGGSRFSCPAYWPHWRYRRQPHGRWIAQAGSVRLPAAARPRTANLPVDARPIARIENTLSAARTLGTGTLVDVDAGRGLIVTCATCFATAREASWPDSPMVRATAPGS